MDEERLRGLPAIHEARQKRKKGTWPQIPPRFWLWTGTVLLAWAVFYWKKTQGEIESSKAKIFARQRAVAAELGPRFDPLRKEIEDWTIQAAGPYTEDRIDPAARTWDFAAVPGIYLRMRRVDATSAKSIRKAANASLRDGFTACFFHEPNVDPTTGPPCKATHECASGSFCNEVDHCSPAAQPYNMRAAYRGTRILSDEWTVDLRTADDDMRMRLLEREFDGVVRDDVPLAIDLMTRAQFYLLVLDEDPPGKTVDAGLEGVQALPHAARVFLWKLKGDGERGLVRLRRDLDAHFVSAGERPMTDPEILEAQQRQVNSCQLALVLRDALASK